jgi:hypothetical protein
MVIESKVTGSADLNRKDHQGDQRPAHLNHFRDAVHGSHMRSLLLTLSFVPLTIAAQHCGYDFASIIMVNAHRAHTNAVEPDLRITLIDTNNLPAVINGENWNRFRPNDGGSKLPDRTWQPHFERHRG